MARPALTSPTEIADAVISVVADDGLDAVSIRTVARRASISIGAVQHYFATKDELLLAAYQRVIDRFIARARRLPDRTVHPAAYVRALLHELLPLDPPREAELRVAIAFTARSVHNRGLTELYTDGYRALVDAIADALRHAIALGQAAPGVDVRREATRAVALADGLAWHALCAPTALTNARAVTTLDAHLSLLLPDGRARSREPAGGSGSTPGGPTGGQG